MSVGTYTSEAGTTTVVKYIADDPISPVSVYTSGTLTVDDMISPRLVMGMRLEDIQRLKHFLDRKGMSLEVFMEKIEELDNARN